jgi:hypothetical protein
MSAQNGDTVMQEEALDEEEELPFGGEKLKVVSLSTALIHAYCGCASFFALMITFIVIRSSRGLGSNAGTATGCDGDGCFVPD